MIQKRPHRRNELEGRAAESGLIHKVDMDVGFLEILRTYLYPEGVGGLD